MAARSAEQTRALQEEFAEWLALDVRDRKRLRLPETQEAWAGDKAVSVRTLNNWRKLPHVAAIVTARLEEKKAAKLAVRSTGRSAAVRPSSATLPAEHGDGDPQPTLDDLEGLTDFEADYARFRRVIIEKAADPDSDPRWAQLAANKLFNRLIDAEVDNADIDLSGKSDLELACMLPFEIIEQAYQILAPPGYFDNGGLGGLGGSA